MSPYFNFQLQLQTLCRSCIKECKPSCIWAFPDVEPYNIVFLATCAIINIFKNNIWTLCDSTSLTYKLVSHFVSNLWDLTNAKYNVCDLFKTCDDHSFHAGYWQIVTLSTSFTTTTRNIQYFLKQCGHLFESIHHTYSRTRKTVLLFVCSMKTFRLRVSCSCYRHTVIYSSLFTIKVAIT